MNTPSEQLTEILESFGVHTGGETVEKVLAYTGILLRWNRRINLTGIREPVEIWRRHFGESFYLARLVDLASGCLVDVGSGAGFPGLALKLVFPCLDVILLEPVGKKAAFLAEVVRQLGLKRVDILRQRWQEWSKDKGACAVNFVTLRGVGDQEKIVAGAAHLLAPGGQIILLLSTSDAVRIAESSSLYNWRTEKIPGTQKSVVLIGRRA